MFTHRLPAKPLFRFAMLLALAAVLIPGCGSDPAPRATGEGAAPADSAAPVRAGHLEMGGTLPDFELPTLDGGTLRLSDLQDGAHYVAVVWHAPTCPCAENCVLAISDELTGPEYADFRVVAVISDPMMEHDWFQEDLAKQAEEGLLPFPVVLDWDKSVLRQYGAPRTPTVWLADKEGRIRFYGAPENTLEPRESGYRFLLKEALDALKAGREPEIAYMEPIGCLINWDNL